MSPRGRDEGCSGGRLEKGLTEGETLETPESSLAFGRNGKAGWKAPSKPSTTSGVGEENAHQAAT
jgi:hypothetical protein